MKQGAFAFRFTDALPYLLLDSIGWQSTDSPYYGNDGRERSDFGHIVFQYTLSGEGRIELEGKSYSLTPGKAFLVKVPSDHRYYYSAKRQSHGSLYGLMPRERMRFGCVTELSNKKAQYSLCMKIA
ncbi:AraC family ligand binding domain-containing protein [Paenibacillus sp. IITD108]|uniref:AraC family ligand binding domain-containing protein n=1 Tax=Paenibacillus sp. IITD108 TaxID=3116649 RepID=UPI002F41827A